MDRVGFEPTTSALLQLYRLSKGAPAMEREELHAQIPPIHFEMLALRGLGEKVWYKPVVTIFFASFLPIVPSSILSSF
jgi:hypothetical protein